MRIRKTASGITAAIMLATVVCSPLCDNLPLTSGGVAVVAAQKKRIAHLPKRASPITVIR